MQGRGHKSVLQLCLTETQKPSRGASCQHTGVVAVGDSRKLAPATALGSQAHVCTVARRSALGSAPCHTA